MARIINLEAKEEDRYKRGELNGRKVSQQEIEAWQSGGSSKPAAKVNTAKPDPTKRGNSKPAPAIKLGTKTTPTPEKPTTFDGQPKKITVRKARDAKDAKRIIGHTASVGASARQGLQDELVKEKKPNIDYNTASKLDADIRDSSNYSNMYAAKDRSSRAANRAVGTNKPHAGKQITQTGTHIANIARVKGNVVAAHREINNAWSLEGGRNNAVFGGGAKFAKNAAVGTDSWARKSEKDSTSPAPRVTPPAN